MIDITSGQKTLSLLNSFGSLIFLYLFCALTTVAKTVHVSVLFLLII